ncbi:hypothetical protein RUMCAL_02717 [Ruminococcus callidus ATCC 27760]|uniref:Uncharacterized protein n=1 Tax=Ruminococcus callidus ATCC 27760 TaxID=411473 RepID=U2JX97_9FIRM|nr:hypothetical protein RUMCAL_02717 [Ruminococcus callidus ATCC 27760]
MKYNEKRHGTPVPCLFCVNIHQHSEILKTVEPVSVGIGGFYSVKRVY